MTTNDITADFFRGKDLPRDLGRRVSGVHFNFGCRGRPETQRYFATAADFLWNPTAWESADSCRRAGRFLDVLGGVDWLEQTAPPDGDP